MNCSIISYPERGPWGSSIWKGNCSGYVYKDIFDITIPDYKQNERVFVDPMVGSGTSIDIARELGIRAYGLDLKDGFDILTESIKSRVGQEADLCISHPPYHNMIIYSGNVWGDKEEKNDLSRCKSIEEFYEKMIVALVNQRDAVKRGGWYGTIIGDMRKNGEYYSMQAELQARMDKTEYKATLIKAQHNVSSNNIVYNNKLPRIMHEYILLWQKKSPGLIIRIVEQQEERINTTWAAVVRYSMNILKGEVSLSNIYEYVKNIAPEKIENNPNWKAKIRQTIQKSEDIVRVARGKYKETEIER